MKIKYTFLATVLFMVVLFSFTIEKRQPAVLVFSLTKGFRHKSIPEGLEAIKSIGEKEGFKVVASEDVNDFTDENLSKYRSLILLNSTGTNVFSSEQKSAFQNFVRKGGGVVGIHAATDFCYEWDWYGKMIGAYFEKHPKVQEAKIIITDKKSLMTKHLPNPWIHTDEWYNFKSFNKQVHVLLKLDETSYTGGTMGNDHPASWYHKFEGGKVFYTLLGHTPETYKDKLFIKHLTEGIKSTF